ncbi:MAG: capsular biosynthesis protein [Anaerolineae bacterium]|nr:capsular biosynthesis protein [Anaerolineae bacterium]MDW8071466.1 CpsB/CapC family capsule biosynthesis tyrosine phosphatase [Anaerolineae bacterium]
MIDTHCHILPGLDDGAASLDEALRMARIAVAEGVRWIVATPHQEGWSATACQRIQAAVQNLQRELNLNGIPLSLSSGVELLVTHTLLQTSGDERVHTLNGSRYVLLELPAFDYPLYTAEVIFSLQLRGLVPILAHPERNVIIQDDISRIVRLVQRGVLVQLSVDSLSPSADRDVRRCAQELLRRGLVHLLASDAHNAGRRAPRLAAGVRAAARIVGLERAQAMVTSVPEAILGDRELDIEMMTPPSPRRWWQRLFDTRDDSEA